MVEKYPEEMIERAVKGMLPKGRLGRAMNKKDKIVVIVGIVTLIVLAILAIIMLVTILILNQKRE